MAKRLTFSAWAMPGRVCLFGVNPGVRTWLDESMQRFETVLPACGSANSAIELCEQLEELAEHMQGWLDVCKGVG